MENYLPWILLLIHVFILLGIDFFVFHKKNEPTKTKKAIWETTFFVANALAFCGIIYWVYLENYLPNNLNYSPMEAIMSYLTGYMIELSLSVDNLFVIAVIFVNYRIPSQYQHRLLFLGVLGAIVFRAIMIALGLVLINKIHQITIIFGLFLVYTAFKMLKKEEHSEENSETKGIAKFFNISKIIDGNKFRTKVNGKYVFTALFGALITIEFTDLLFALDSIPAIFAVTTDSFIVFSSNIFAILGLRSLYFFLANMLEKFRYLKYSVFAILIFVGIKLILLSWYTIPAWFSLAFIGLSLAVGIGVSIARLNRE